MAPLYGATVPAARRLALDVAAEGQRVGQAAPRVSDADVLTWLMDGAARVSLRIGRAVRLPLTVDLVPAGTGLLDQVTVETLARHLVELYAAALLADVTHPERVRADKGYGQVLQARFEAGLKDLVAAVDAAADRAADVAPGEPGNQSDVGADAYFPPPTFTKTTGF